MRNSNKKVIVVKGSEDGVLGVATNMKEAIKIAISGNGYTFASYSKLVKGETIQYDPDDHLVCIEFDTHYLNGGK